MEAGNTAFNSYKLLSQRDELKALDDAELKALLEKASRKSINSMLEFTTNQIKGALEFLGIDTAGDGIKGWGDKRKKSTWVKMAIHSLSVFHFDDINKAINKLSLALSIQNPVMMEADEKDQLEAQNKTVTDERIQTAIDAVDASIEKVKTVAKKVTKAEEKLKKQLELNRLPADVRWESDFMGVVTIGKEYREFWVNDPYSDPVVNLVTSNGTIILSGWDTTKDNPFMIAAIREFQNLIHSRAGLGDITDRLMSVSLQLVGSKKRADWYAQSHEGLVLKDGQKMEAKKSWLPPERLRKSTEYDFASGVAYRKSQYFARSFPGKYDYIEGFTLINNRLYHHAWLRYKSDGVAVDVTLSDPGQLFGVAIDVKWVDQIIASRVKDEKISGCYRDSIIEGAFLDDFKVLQSGLATEAIAC